MHCARSVLLLLLLSAGSLSPPLAAQEAKGRPATQSEQGFHLEQNYPNPVNPETWIPFYLEDGLFESSDSVVVSVRIYNILRQVVAIPKALDHPSGKREDVINLTYRSSGRKLAYWDGRDSAGRRVPSGVYYCELVLDGQPRPQIRKVIVLNPQKRRSIVPWFRK